MVAIHPFRALRYNPERAGELSRLIAPPYDVIDEVVQERLYQVSPYNIVRLILGKQDPHDTPNDNRYTRALRDFTGWCENQVLRPDPAPAIYVIEHTFEEQGRPRARLGFVALLELRDGVERDVYRHEATLDAPKADRTKLLETVPANLSPIFCVYPDAGGAVQARLQDLARHGAPAAQAAINNERIRLWVVTDPDVIRDVAERLAPVAVLIADGHHRFEVAYAKRQQYGALMSYFVSMEDPSLMLQPIHRVVQYGAAAGLQVLHSLCAVERASDLSSVMRWLQAEGGEGRFGCYDGRDCYRVTVKPTSLARWLMSPPFPLPVATLDVSLLHGLILPSLNVNGTGVRYTPDASQALRMVEGGQGSLAWLLRPLSLQQVYALAAQGFALPPKSTYFYPKVPSGLTINPLA